MSAAVYHNRRVVQVENDSVRVSVTVEGGHIAEILHKKSGINPLWLPSWPSIEPTTYDPKKHPEYGNYIESSLLCGIMGHNLCLDLFGVPSAEEEAADIPVHGEANVIPWQVASSGTRITASCAMRTAQLGFERVIELEGQRLRITETVENLAPLDRAIAWTQHVTMGPPFVKPGSLQLRLPGTKSRGIGESTDFEWPMKGKEDLRRFAATEPAGGYNAHLLDPASDIAYFFAYSPESRVQLGYVWRRTDFPWLGVWRENKSRPGPPWNGNTITCGMEFGVSPFPETRRAMIDRNNLWGVPGYKWVPAKTRLRAEYWAGIGQAPAIAEDVQSFEGAINI